MSKDNFFKWLTFSKWDVLCPKKEEEVERLHRISRANQAKVAARADGTFQFFGTFCNMMQEKKMMEE